MTEDKHVDVHAPHYYDPEHDAHRKAADKLTQKAAESVKSLEELIPTEGAESVQVAGAMFDAPDGKHHEFKHPEPVVEGFEQTHAPTVQQAGEKTSTE